ncbi:MAG TPA: hypothetical protein VGP19_09850 [Candidatus Acidoferrales bacterium]|jgi:hypothetical protein|nr:hypothetical protein [Candidatus Acidoferrales bacterium]
MIGILVCGDNHFIVRGLLPDRAAARALARQWSIIQIGQTVPPCLRSWSMVTRAFREDLAWAVIVPGEGEITGAVAQLLQELSARGIAIRNDLTDH